jgi:hypothetical protein
MCGPVKRIGDRGRQAGAEIGESARWQFVGAERAKSPAATIRNIFENPTRNSRLGPRILTRAMWREQANGLEPHKQVSSCVSVQWWRSANEHIQIRYSVVRGGSCFPASRACIRMPHHHTSRLPARDFRQKPGPGRGQDALDPGPPFPPSRSQDTSDENADGSGQRA